MSGEIESILGDLDDLADSEAEVSVGDVMDKLGHRGTGAFLAIPGLVGISPIGGIPTVPSLMAAIVLILSCQIVYGRRRLWLPEFFRDRAVDDGKLMRATDLAGGTAQWLDRWFGDRLVWATGRAANRIAGAISALLACMVPPLELIPFAAAIPLGGVTLIGLALLLKDGFLMLVALAASLAAIYGAWVLMPF